MESTQKDSNYAHNVLIVNNKSVVKNAENYEFTKENFRFFREAIKYIGEQYDSVPVARLTKIIEGKEGLSFTLSETIFFFDLATDGIATLSKEIDNWTQGQGDDISVRLAMYHRLLLSFVLYNLAEYQNRVIYNVLTKGE